MEDNKKDSSTIKVSCEENIVMESIYRISKEEWTEMLQDLPKGELNAIPDNLKIF